MSVTRRRFIALAAAAAAALTTAAPAWAQRLFTLNDVKERRRMYRLSSRGRRVSRKTKIHNASMRFATKEAADRFRVNRYDRSRIVPLDISGEEFHRLFVSRHSQIVDLRDLSRFAAVRR